MWTKMDQLNPNLKLLNHDNLHECHFSHENPNSPITSALVLKRLVASNLLVVLPAAQGNASRIRSEYYQLWQHESFFPNFHLLCLSDPILKMGTGAFATYGCHEDVDAVANMAEVVKLVADSVGIEDKNILFYGFSQGGYLAAQVATFFPESAAFLQVSPLKVLDSAQKEQLEIMRTKAFGDSPWSRVCACFPERMELVERFKKMDVIPNLCLLTNAKDFTYQLALTFLDELSEIREKISYSGETSIILHPSARGHMAIPVAELAARLSHYASSSKTFGIGPKSKAIGEQILPGVDLSRIQLGNLATVSSSEQDIVVGESMSWFSVNPVEGNFSLRVNFDNVPRAEKDAVLASFSLRGAKNKIRDQISLSYSSNRSIRWFQYLSLDEGSNCLDIPVRLPKGCSVDAIGFRTWRLAEEVLHLTRLEVQVRS